MQKISTLLFLLILFCTNAFGQTPTFDWAKTYGGEGGSVTGICTKVDEFGNIYTLGGMVRDSADLDPGPGIFRLTYYGWMSMFIQKLDANGNFIWAKQVAGNNYPNTIQIDHNQNVLISGSFGGTCDFDPNGSVQNRTPSNGTSYLLKLDSAGNFKWVYNYGTTIVNNLTYASNEIIVNDSDDIILIGTYDVKFNFSNTGSSNIISRTPSGVADLYFLTLSTNGIFKKLDTISAIGASFYVNKAKKSNNKILITGLFSGNKVDFNMGSDSSILSTGSSGMWSPFILSLNDTFGFNWVRKIEYYSSAWNILYNKINCSDISEDSKSNIIVAGTFNGTYDFNTDTGSSNIVTLNSSGIIKSFIIKFKNNGNFVYAKSFDGETINLAIGKENSLFLSGNFIDYSDFDPGTGVELRYGFQYDIFLNHLDSNSEFIDVITYGGPGYNGCRRLFVDDYKSLYLLSTFYDSIDVNPDINIDDWRKNQGYQSIALSKFRQCTPSSSSLSISECSSYTINNRTYTASGVYRILVFNSTGCDSTITLTLTIKNTKASITRVVCDSVLVNNNWYSKTGTYTQMLTNAANCDSTLTINVSIRNNVGSYAATSCDSIRVNNVLYTSSGVYKQTLTNRFGCDSVVTLTITIKSSSFNTLSYTQCDSIRINNILYSSSGTYKQKFTNAAGCDSFLTLNITIHKASQGSKVYTACDSIQINNIKYYKTGYYSQSLTTTHGCDSVLNITLTINKAQVNPNIQNVSGCDSLKIDNITYTQSGNHQHHYTSSTGCDSAVDYAVTIRHASSGSVALTYCRTATINGIKYNSSGNYSQHLNNSEGCDSALQINLTLVNADKTVTKNGLLLSANQSGALYQWLDCNSNYAPILNANVQSYTVTQNGQYAVRIKLGTCFDTSQCIPITGVGINNASSGKPVVQITPNPFNQDIRVSISEINSNHSPIQISLIDAQGRVVATQTLNENNTSDFSTIINTTTLASGIYFIQIKNEGFVSIHKIVKN